MFGITDHDEVVARRVVSTFDGRSPGGGSSTLGEALELI
jgi:hypothetical protein